ncbi:uncharacterized protein LOC132257165 [Phlebotomus argentipes]|uniref:uncharacterized protein LOC132257165 n=1 Tax=Phlebotomus argentipes TaxID=94469 RepID=UPI002893274D|nr:uncharacterized protein LOC132257165 [Phlebotomus argentipes]
MSRVYSALEFEEAILANSPECFFTLGQLGRVQAKPIVRIEDEDTDDECFEDLKVQALFQKLNPRPEVPGQLLKPESQFCDKEITRLIQETHLLGKKQGRQTVMGNAPNPKNYSKKSKPIVISSSSSDCVEIVEEPKKKPKKRRTKLLLNPAALQISKTASTEAPKPETPEPPELLSSEKTPKPDKNQQKPKEKFYSPKELYELKKGLEKAH